MGKRILEHAIASSKSERKAGPSTVGPMVSDDVNRVLHICHISSAFGGGLYFFLQQIANWQASDGHRVTVIYDTSRGIPSTLAQDFHRDIELVPWTVGREIKLISGDIPALIHLFRQLRKSRPDIVHLYASKAGALGRVVARLLRIPNLYSPQGIAVFRTDVSPMARAVFSGLERILSAIGGTVVACSQDEFDYMKPLFRSVHLIPNAVDVGEIDNIVGEARPTPGMHRAPEKPFTVAVLGRIAVARNPELIVRIADSSPPQWRWLWIGDGENRDVVQLSSRIQIIGWMERAEALRSLCTADVLLHASAWEGMPIAVLEAMAVGMPVVASNVVGSRDLIQDGETGVLIDREADYLPALGRLAADPDLRETLGGKARLQVLENHSFSGIRNLWKKAYEQEIAKGPSSKY